ncbi:MAG: 3-deoxy-7-phosphoheptulonate synthase [Proteobacteria bacterium]|nr:MAG: 3-deoxy-7-phosphoheptulonate synthase [Pseudomonadota bacterium]
MTHNTDDLRITDMEEVTSPAKIMQELPVTDKAADTVFQARQEAHRIIKGKDDRLLVVVGPCSIHDTQAAHEYADRLLRLKDELKDDLQIIMRVYFEKPRTSVGWKGLINDPDISGEFNINKGLRVARRLLVELSEKGMPAATEFLDLISPQYVADLISWGAIGARTTESQGHRELASGSSCPIGFKNGTYGNVDIAINAIKAAANPHHFLSVTKQGHSAIFTTSGNEDCHVILRGGLRPNYDSVSIEEASNELRKSGLSPSLMVDFSHANSRKNHNNQLKVAANIANQISSGSYEISGVMIESHLVAGNQKGEGVDKSTLTYGQSITDACIGWDDTDKVLRRLAAAVRKRREVTQEWI